MQNLPVSSDALTLHCLPFPTPDVGMWVQDTAGVRPVAGVFLLVPPEMFPEDFHRLSLLGFLMLFEVFLW